MTKPIRVLFVCTGNSARSQMAEAMLRHIGKGRFEVFSGGTAPKAEIHPFAVRALRELGISMEGQHPKDVAQVAGQSFDYVITLCERSIERCPAFPGAETMQWSFADPTGGDPAELAMMKRFHETVVGLERRIRLLAIVEEPKSSGRA
ncbi:MAG: arsenate reductase ArsC [Polyangiales bacterium]